LKKLIPLLAFLLLTACTLKKAAQEGVLTIDLTGNLSRQKEFFLSDIATDIEYVKLDNSIEAAIQQVEKYVITDQYLLIYDRMLSKVLLFDRLGKFLRQISRPGKGPGEYNRPQDMSMDPAGQFIYITFSKQINIYRITGEFVKATPLPSWADFVEPFGDAFLAVFPSYYSTLVDNYTFIFFKKDGTMGEKLLKRNWNFLKPGAGMKNPKLYKYNELFCYREAYFDTVYAVTSDRKVIPHFCFKKDKEVGDGMTGSGFYLDGWKELPDYIFISGAKDQRMHNLIYDRKTSDIWYIPYDTATNTFGITNDLDGGLPVWSGKPYKGKMYALDYGIRMRTAFGKFAGRPFIAKLPERRKQLEEFVANLKEDDNQILTIVTLKK